MEEVTGQLSRCAETTKRNAGQRPEQSGQEELSMEVHEPDAVPPASYEQQEETAGVVSVLHPATSARRERSLPERERTADRERFRIGSRILPQTEAQRTADGDRPEVRLSL